MTTALRTPEVLTTPRLLGVEIKGIDAAEPLSPTALKLLTDTLHSKSVVYLRNQQLTDVQLAAFCRQFGPLKLSNLGRFMVPEFPELNIVSNIRKNGEYIGNPDAGVFWHSDSAYTHEPDIYTFLYSIKVPTSNGKSLGSTSFASTSAAYEALPDDVKAKLDGLMALQDARYQQNKKKAAGHLRRGDITPHQEKVGLATEHPVARPHPITGKKALFVSESHTASIVGLPEKESDELLQFLNHHIAQPQFIYKHEWQVGDLLIWDNPTTVHRADFDYSPDQPRLMHRASTVGSQ